MLFNIILLSHHGISRPFFWLCLHIFRNVIFTVRLILIMKPSIIMDASSHNERSVKKWIYAKICRPPRTYFPWPSPLSLCSPGRLPTTLPPASSRAPYSPAWTSHFMWREVERMPDRRQMLKEINEISFVINDLTLFLDTHPLEPTALEAFSQAMDCLLYTSPSPRD